MKKNLIYFLLLLLMSASLKASFNNDVSNDFSRIKDFSIGVGLAFVTHIITERLVIGIHENGHSLASMLTGGNFEAKECPFS